MPDFSPELLESIRNNQFDDVENFTDTQLYLSGQALNKKQMSALAEALAHNKSIEEVDLSGCSISNQGIISFAQTFARTLEKIKKITPTGSEPKDGLWSRLFKFNLACNNIKATGIKKLWDAFPLQALDISENPIGDKGALVLADTSISSLKAEWCSISHIGASALFANATFEELDLSSNSGIKEEAFKALAANQSTALRKLTMKQAGLNAACAQYIAQKASLKAVCLTTNNLGDEGAEHFASSKVERLILSGNSIGDKGASALGKSTSTIYLDLFSNRVTSEGVKGLSSNQNLTHLNLSHNKVDGDCVPFLCAIKNLQLLDLENNYIIGKQADELKQTFSFVRLACNREPTKALFSKTNTVPVQNNTPKKRKEAISRATAEAACNRGKTYLPRYQCVNSGAKKVETDFNATIALNQTKNKISNKKIKI